jgi:transposase
MRKIEACPYVRPSDRATLERLVADGKTPQKLVARARVVLLSGRGVGTNATRREARVSKPTVWRWQQAYMEGGIERLLKDKGKGPRAGMKRIGDEVRLRIVAKTAQENPENATHWSARMMAEEMGVGHTTVQPIWRTASSRI